MEYWTKPEMKKAWIALLAIWAAMVFCLIIYGLVCVFLDKSGQLQPIEMPQETLNILLLVLSVLSPLTLAAAWFLRSNVSRSKAKKPIAFVLFTNKDDLHQSPGSPSVEQASASIYTVISLVAWALCESVGIYGLVLYMLSQNLFLFWPFFGMAMAGMILLIPKKLEVEMTRQNLVRLRSQHA